VNASGASGKWPASTELLVDRGRLERGGRRGARRPTTVVAARSPDRSTMPAPRYS
jgi:hypothetical protein